MTEELVWLEVAKIVFPCGLGAWGFYLVAAILRDLINKMN